MALIYCPNCGKQISDQAKQCPHCGKKLKQAKHSKKYVLVSLIIIALIVVGAGIMHYRNALHVESIQIQNWKYDSEGSTDNYDYYDAEIVSNETKPFVAVIQDPANENGYPSLAYVEDGKGDMRISVDKDEDPSKNYKAIGYMDGKAVDESIIQNIAINEDEDRNNYLDLDALSLTLFSGKVEISLNHDWTGFLICDIHNDISAEASYNCKIEIVNGKGKYFCALFDLPYKTRGVNFQIIPKVFCEVHPVSENDYTVSKEYSLTKDESSYSGEIEYTFDNCQKGWIIYSKTLTAGGQEENRNKEQTDGALLNQGKAVLSTYDEGVLLIPPEYDFKIYGYLTWETLE